MPISQGHESTLVFALFLCSLDSAAGGMLGSAAALLEVVVALRKWLGKSFPESSRNSSGLLPVELLRHFCHLTSSLTFLGFTLASALFEIASKPLIVAAFTPVASSCWSVCRKAFCQQLSSDPQSSHGGRLLGQSGTGDGCNLTF